MPLAHNTQSLSLNRHLTATLTLLALWLAIGCGKTPAPVAPKPTATPPAPTAMPAPPPPAVTNAPATPSPTFMPPNVPAAPQPIANTPAAKPPYTIEPIVVGEAVSANEAFQKFVAHYGQNRVIRLVLQFTDGDAPPQTGDWLKAGLRQLTPPGIPQSVHVSRQGATARAIVGPARPLASLHGSFKWDANAVLDYPSRTVTVPAKVADIPPPAGSAEEAQQIAALVETLQTSTDYAARQKTMDQLSQFRSPAGIAAYFALGRKALQEGKVTGGLMDYDSRFKRHGPAAEQVFLTWLATALEENKAGDLKAAMIGMQLKEIGGEAALVELAKLTSSAHPNVAKTAQEVSDEIQRRLDGQKKIEAQARADDETTPTPISPDVKLAVMARTLDDDFRHDPEGTRKKYNGQLIEVVGDLSAIRYTFQGKTSYALMTNAGPMSMSFLCDSTQALHSKQFVPGQRVVIKGRADLEGMLSLKEAQIIDAQGPEPIEVTSEALVQEFADPEKIAAASKKYAGRWLLVTGKIKELQGNNNHAALATGVDMEVQISLMDIPEAQQKALQAGQTIVFLGRFDKYDPYQIEVELDNCVLVARPMGP